MYLYVSLIILCLIVLLIIYILKRQKLKKLKKKAKKAKTVFTKENMTEIITDLPRHKNFKYANKDSLDSEYFDIATASLEDKNLYLVFSNTGSVPSEIISVFTEKEYNHISLSFDKDLATLVSFNGGEQVLPPGLNQEKLTYFNKKADASAAIYSLSVTAEQKKKIIEKVEQINEEGSSYNIVGLVVPYSHKPNIMYCSQFVYAMLEYAGVNYFDKSPRGSVKPTDFIELDSDNKLTLIKEIKFNTPE